MSKIGFEWHIHKTLAPPAEDPSAYHWFLLALTRSPQRDLQRVDRVLNLSISEGRAFKRKESTKLLPRF